MGKIFYLMGKSASGKDTIYKRLLERDTGLRSIVLYTTRPMREGEKDGVEYHFTTAAVLDTFAGEGRVIEQRVYQTVMGPWVYATVDDGQINLAQGDYLGIGTLESYLKIRAYYGEKQVIPLYIAVDDGVRLERALLREKSQKVPNYAELCRRYLADEQDFSPEKLEAGGIGTEYRNDDLDRCIEEIWKRIFLYTS